jgi:predicted DNA-binding protein with PD1-like motif
MMKTFPIRLTPGQDLRTALEAVVQSQDCRAAFVLSGIGSLSTAGLRFAGVEQPERLTGDMEILSLSGTVAFDGVKSSSHLHMALSTSTGQVLGGHVAAGCIVRTTAEVLLALLPEWEFVREPDTATGYDELVVRMGGDAIRVKLAELNLTETSVTDAVDWVRATPWVAPRMEEYTPARVKEFDDAESELVSLRQARKILPDKD